MTKDYTDDEAREAVTILREIAERMKTEGRDGNVWCAQNEYADRIRDFGKPPEPKRWPLALCGGTVNVELSGDGTAFVCGNMRIFTEGCDMDRLFVAWAEERGIDLPYAAACVRKMELEVGLSDLPEYTALRAALDNTRSKA